MSDGAPAIERACYRRYPAWTLYARAFSGSRLEAENIVRRAVAQTSHSSEAPSSEADAHRRVLRSIRSSALSSIRPDKHSAPSVLDILDRLDRPDRLDRLDSDPRSTSTLTLDKLRDLTRSQRRVIELVLLRRPPLPLDEAARKLSTSRAAVVNALERALNALAFADAFWPNPWAEHATRESVPGWFHDFFYGERRDAQSTESDAARGLELLVQGELEQTIETLEPLVENAESKPEARASLGIARYLTGDTSRSTVRLLEDDVDGRRAGRLSRWYLAIVLLTRRDIHGARVHLKALASTGDWFGRAAKALLEKLDEASRTRTTA